MFISSKNNGSLIKIALYADFSKENAGKTICTELLKNNNTFSLISYTLFTTKQEALSLASIVEKETGIPTERGKVASVFINRLRKGMRLQSDPTVIYSFAMGNKDLEREIRKSDIARMSEYNTYRIKGIPQKPIANAGKDAIRAVLRPEKTNYLYFVATGNGGHNFSSTLDEHNTFVKEYRQKLKQSKENVKAD